jgi:hypothetical protein
MSYDELRGTTMTTVELRRTSTNCNDIQRTPTPTGYDELQRTTTNHDELQHGISDRNANDITDVLTVFVPLSMVPTFAPTALKTNVQHQLDANSME